MLNTSKQEVPAKNEIYSYFAVPIQAFQGLGGSQQLEPLAIILKTIPDGTLQVVQANNFINIQEASETAPKANTTATDKMVCLPKPKSLLQKKPAIVNHIQEQVSTNKHKCSICSEYFPTLLKFRKHMEEHSDKRKFKCDQCSACFNIETNLKLHKAIHTKGPLTCPNCEKTFQRTASLKCHLMLHQIDESFCCQECSLVFEREDDLEKHMDIHKKESIKIESHDSSIPLICSFCNYLFEDAGKYKEHVTHHMKVNKSLFSKKRSKRSSQKNYVHKCSVCSKSFPKMSLLERHMRIHSGEKPYVCHICHRGFSQSGTLQIHITSRHEGLKPYKCELCPARFNQKGNLRVHLSKTHTAPPGERVYKCSHCTCIYKRVATLNGHIAKAHATENAREVDDINDIMEQLKALEQKTKSVGEKGKKMVGEVRKVTEELELEKMKEGAVDGLSYVKLADSSVDGVVRRYLVKQKKVGDVRWYMCNYCVKEFKKPSDLIRHIRVHTREKPFKCSQCHQSFSLKSTLVSHTETHIGNKDCKCAVCEKSFASIRTLNVHMRKHEREKSPNNSDQYKCMTCSKIFNSLSKAKAHLESHSGESDQEIVVLKQPILETANGFLSVAAPRPRIPLGEMEQYRNRPYSCNQCSAVFKKMVHLKRHMLIHTGDKKFQCNSCSKSFYTSYALKEHSNFHTGVKNFACKICNKRFITNAILKRHLVTHTTHKPYICPYCKKRFKTVLICRKHIKTHKKEGKIFKGVLDQVVEAPETAASSVINIPIDSLLNNNEIQTKTELNLEGGNLGTTFEGDIVETGHVLPQTQSTANFQTAENPTAIYITYEDLQTLNSNLYQNAIMPQLKLQLNIQPEPSNSNPPEDPPVLFPSDIPITTEVLTDLTPNIFLNLDGKFSTFESAQPLTSNLLNDLESPKIEKQMEKFDSLLVDDQNLKLIAEANAALPEELNTMNFVKPEEVTLLDNLGVDDGKMKEEVRVRQRSGGDERKKGIVKRKMVTIKEAKKKGKRKKKNELEFICSVCKKEFEIKEDLVKHLMTHKSKENVCNYCGKVFKKPSDLTRHIRTHTGEKPYKCDKCDKSFSLKSTLESHYRTHNPVNPKEFNCNVCNSYFCSKASLKVHMMIHTDMKPYQCRFCSLKFRTSGHRKFHETSHKSGKIGQNKAKANMLASVALETVQEKLVDEDALLQSALSGTDLTPTIHITDHPDTLTTQTIQIDPSLLQQLQANGFLLQQDDGEDPLSVIQLNETTDIIVTDNSVVAEERSEKIRKFECEICHKKYASKDVLTKHMKRHGKKAFRCEKCKVGLANQVELDNHLKWHAGYRPFSCKFCTNCFGEEGSLKTHMKRIHAEQIVAKDSAIDLDFIFT